MPKFPLTPSPLMIRTMHNDIIFCIIQFLYVFDISKKNVLNSDMNMSLCIVDNVYRRLFRLTALNNCLSVLCVVFNHSHPFYQLLLFPLLPFSSYPAFNFNNFKMYESFQIHTKYLKICNHSIAISEQFHKQIRNMKNEKKKTVSNTFTFQHDMFVCFSLFYVTHRLLLQQMIIMKKKKHPRRLSRNIL